MASASEDLTLEGVLEGSENASKCTPAELLLKVVLAGTLSHYECRGMIDDKRLEHLLLAGKQILYKSHQESEVRQNLGFSPDVWQGLTDVLSKAIPVLESQSFAWKSVNPSNYDGSSSNLIAYNYFSLVKDIDRLNDLCTIARNLLATTKKAQNLAAEKGFDQQILTLLDTCVRVTARGYDGEANQRNEDRWQKVVNLYKRLSITCLQFLHNFIMHNEQRKLVLWLDLFGQHQNAEASAVMPLEPLDLGQPVPKGLAPAVLMGECLFAPPPRASSYPCDQTAEDLLLETLSTFPREPSTIKEEAAMVLLTNIKEHMEKLLGRSLKEIQQMGKDPERVKEIRAALTAILGVKLDTWAEKNRAAAAAAAAEEEEDDEEEDDTNLAEDEQSHDEQEQQEHRQDRQTEQCERQQQQQRQQQQATQPQQATPPQHHAIPKNKRRILVIDRSATAGYPLMTLADYPDIEAFSTISNPDAPVTVEDMTLLRSVQSAAKTIQEAKNELMARLQDTSHILTEEHHVFDNETGTVVTEDGSAHMDQMGEDSVDEEEEEEEEDDDEYNGRPGDQQRGLLTDIPLVLGPSEIEALPMIIQAGIVDSFGLKGGEMVGSKNMQAVRCHMLLSQDNGRALLRELLIFIAAWDLPEGEFYFKMMVQIMEAVLKNGLMSHAYAEFGQPKDIISPAQAVVIKILTHIFRAKYSPPNIASMTESSTGRSSVPLTKVDVLTVRYIFTIFRGNIIPETCALIYLQGQIRAGNALPEDFPLNLWDMERVYEGVYQFLEFFAVLTENTEWKNLLVRWDIVYDLVTLIKELDMSIPKGSLTPANPAGGLAATMAANMETNAAAVAAAAAQLNRNANDVAAAQQQPYDRVPPPPPAAGQQQQTAANIPVAVERPYDPSDPEPADTATVGTDSRAQSPPPGNDDPSEFEWRNLKKLVVLVLSSLVWKCPEVQDQIRVHGGVEAILNCTSFDAYNPYIKEHAVMCLKFLLDHNRENQKIVEELEAREAVRDDTGVLEKNGYQVVLNDVGKLAIQVKKDATSEGEVEELSDEEK
ncbi:copper transport protein [Ascosphaera pollenicola]|nr:copper transport protein [Ascosphaera pollenicola]